MKKLNTAQKYVIDNLEQQLHEETNTFNPDEINTIKSAIERAVEEIDTDWRAADREANEILQSVSSMVYTRKSFLGGQKNRAGKQLEEDLEPKQKEESTNKEEPEVYDLEEERAKREPTSHEKSDEAEEPKKEDKENKSEKEPKKKEEFTKKAA